MGEGGYVAMAYVVGYGAITAFAVATAWRIKTARERIEDA